MAKTVPEFRDMMTLERDQAPDGLEVPDYQPAVTDIPCQVYHTKGQLTWRNRQMEQLSDFVVVIWDEEALAIVADNRLNITGGRFTGQLLNVTGTQVTQWEHNRPAMLDIFCRERVQ